MKKRKPLKYNTQQIDIILLVSTRADKCGNVFYCVEYGDGDYVCFRNMSSAIDFIETNFKL